HTVRRGRRFTPPFRCSCPPVARTAAVAVETEAFPGRVSLSTLALLSLLAAPPPAPALEAVAELPERPGAVAVVGGRTFVALHPLGIPEPRLLELLPGGRRAPYPSGVLSRGFSAVTALAGDGAGGLWILDAGAEGRPPRITGWNTVDERRLRLLHIPAA